MACQNNNEVFFTPGLFGSGGAVLVVERTYVACTRQEHYQVYRVYLLNVYLLRCLNLFPFTRAMAGLSLSEAWPDGRLGWLSVWLDPFIWTLHVV